MRAAVAITLLSAALNMPVAVADSVARICGTALSSAMVSAEAVAPEVARTRASVDGQPREIILELGHSLRVVEVPSGQLLWDSGAQDRQPAPLLAAAERRARVTLVENAPGAAYRAYIADLRGRLWRLDFPPRLPANPTVEWRLQLLADLGTSLQFTAAPEVLRARDTRGRPFDGLVVAAAEPGPGGSGVAALYYLRDYAVGIGRPIARVIQRSDLQDMTHCAVAPAGCETPRAAGWWVQLRGAGMLPVGRAVIEGGRVLLSAFSAPAVQCDSGRARTFLLALDLATGTALTSAGPLIELGEQRPVAVTPGEGALTLPGTDGPSGGYLGALTALRGRGVFLRYWRDLQVDAD